MEISFQRAGISYLDDFGWTQIVAAVPHARLWSFPLASRAEFNLIGMNALSRTKNMLPLYHRSVLQPRDEPLRTESSPELGDASPL